MKKIFLAIGLVLAGVLVFYIHSDEPKERNVDLIVFSFDRPLQLYALLESTHTYIKGLQDIHVIFRASNKQFEEGYEIVKKVYEKVVFHKQGENPRSDFKLLSLKAAFDSSSSYVVFAVDDIVVKDSIDISACAEALEKYGAYGFYLRLGKNLTQCYSMGREQRCPLLKQENRNIFSWQFNQSQLDWSYPHTVDMTVYRKKDIEKDLRMISYYTPNILEDMWMRYSRKIMGRRGLCYVFSKIVNMPLNRVQHEYKNRAMSEYSSQDLLNKFLNGQKMDIAPLKCVDNKAAHMEYSPTFIMR